MPDVARTLDLPSGQRFECWKHVLAPGGLATVIGSRA
jgi:hypothetical protein